MSKIKRRLSVLLVSLCASAVTAMPAAAADKAPDLSNPKSAAMAFGTALVGGDAAGLRAATVGSEADYKIVDALGKMVGAMKRLSDAAADKYGKDNEITKGTQDTDVAAKLEKADVKVEGDTATIIDKEKADDKNPLKLVKKDGQWKVDLGSIPKDGMDQLVKMAPAMAKAADEVTKEIKDGKHKTAKDAQDAIPQKMMAALMQPGPQGPEAPAGPAPAPPAPQK
jgi:hypothetical protein